MNQQLLQLHAALTCLFPGQHVAVTISVGNYISDEADCSFTLSVSPVGGDFKVIAAQCERPDELLSKATDYARTLNRTTEPKHNTQVPAAS